VKAADHSTIGSHRHRLRIRILGALALLLGAGCSTSKSGFDTRDASPPPNLTGDDGGAVSPDAGPVACTAVSLGSTHRPLDLYIMLDRSNSMDGLPWNAARAALEDFFANPSSPDISVALNYFPNDSVQSCGDLDFYRLFAVPLGPLPSNAPVLKASLDATQGHGNGTPSGDALQGALLTATAQQRAVPDHRVAVVFVSDGLPNACTDEASLDALVANALSEEQTLTFTLSVGTEGAAFMTGVAAAGGTGQTFYASDPPTDLENGLHQAETEAAGCEFLIPKTAPDGRAVDPSEVNVVVMDADGRRTLDEVDGVQNCGNRDSWYYVDPPNPTALRLCPAACDLLQANQAPTVDVTFGCQSQRAQ
jgi:hypothetical protein